MGGAASPIWSAFSSDARVRARRRGVFLESAAPPAEAPRFREMGGVFVGDAAFRAAEARKSHECAAHPTKTRRIVRKRRASYERAANS
jgi:hypothetical protein